MSYSLVIVESPAKCGKIEKFLGPGYKCIASYGHMRELNGLKSIQIENDFKPSFEPSQGKIQHISKMRQLINLSKEVILAADDDREGEAIAWHICDLFNLSIPTTKRIIFHEITESAIKRAIKEPTTLNMNLVHAQQARQILDVIVGYKVSPILWQKISKKTKQGLSAGRCQTPALRLVYENQKDIEKSPGTKVYNTSGIFTSMNLQFQLNFNHNDEEAMSEFLEESVNHDHKYTCGKIRKTTKQPPTPFTTSALQQSASNDLRMSPKVTMDACQKLYEAGYITYMRTDSKTYSPEFIESASKYIDSKHGKEYIRENVEELSVRNVESPKKSKGKGKDKDKDKAKGKGKSKDDDSNAQEAHEAIRPTEITRENVDKEMDPKEARLYKLIWQNTVESCMAAATFNALTATISSPENHEYRHSTEQVVFPGWKVVGGYEKDNPAYHFLQTLKKDSILEYKKIIAKISMKNLKMHYTEAKLVQLLEQNGIGRPSTFSSLIEKIQERGYVKIDDIKGKKIKCIDFELNGDELSEIANEREFGNEKKKMVIQPIGILVIEFLLEHFDSLFQYEFTKKMEDTLDVIAKGNKIWHELCQECLDEVEGLSSKLGPTIQREQIRIDEDHVYMVAKFGPVIKCGNDDKATFKKVRDDIDMDKLRRGEYQLEELIQTTPNLGEYEGHPVYLKKGKFGPYVEWGDNRRSIKLDDKKMEDIKLEDVLEVMKTEKAGNASIIRAINDNASIRTGKYGDYVFYKKANWKKPRFLKLNGFIKEFGANSYKDCELDKLEEWLKKEYNL